jgi:hypothetical protein
MRITPNCNIYAYSQLNMFSTPGVQITAIMIYFKKLFSLLRSQETGVMYSAFFQARALCSSFSGRA